jgi:hypothetical protein
MLREARGRRLRAELARLIKSDRPCFKNGERDSLKLARQNQHSRAGLFFVQKRPFLRPRS